MDISPSCTSIYVLPSTSSSFCSAPSLFLSSSCPPPPATSPSPSSSKHTRSPPSPRSLPPSVLGEIAHGAGQGLITRGGGDEQWWGNIVKPNGKELKVAGIRDINQGACHWWGFSAAIREAIPLRGAQQRTEEGVLYTFKEISKHTDAFLRIHTPTYFHSCRW